MADNHRRMGGRRRLLRGLGIAAAAAAVVLQPLQPPAAWAVTYETYEFAEGYDTCWNISQAGLSDWWNTSPFFEVGLYLGGEDGADVGCTDIGTTKWNYALSIGYGIVPYWYGAQMPTSCGGRSGRPAYISLNTTTATNQGKNEAMAAKSAADAHGLSTGDPIYLDLEAFVNNTGCLAAAKAYVNGFIYQVDYQTRYGGALYGSTCASHLTAMASIAHVPQNIAPADPGVNESGVYGLECLADNLWNLDERIHQSQASINRTYGGYTMWVDADCADGPVLSSVGPKTPHDCGHI